MHQNTMDQGWKQLQFRIDKLVGYLLKEDLPAIEYKTHVAGLLQSSPEYNEQNAEEIS